MKLISVGDLVVVVKPTPCCGSSELVGTIFIVKEFTDNPTRCKFCKVMRNYDMRVRGLSTVYELYRLKRIPPLSELDNIHQSEPEKITA